MHTGTFNLDATMTPQQIVDRLLLPPGPRRRPRCSWASDVGPAPRADHGQAPDRARPGLRARGVLPAAATVRPDWVRQEFPWLRELPEGPQPGRFPGRRTTTSPSTPTSRPKDFLRVLLDRLGEGHRARRHRGGRGESGKDFYDGAHAREHRRARDLGGPRARPGGRGLQNRLRLGGETAGLLQADPTVSYAVDTDRLAKLRATASSTSGRSTGSGARSRSRPSKKVSEDMRSYQTYAERRSARWSHRFAHACLDPRRGPPGHERPATYFFVACKGSQDPQVRQDPRPAPAQRRSVLRLRPARHVTGD